MSINCRASIRSIAQDRATPAIFFYFLDPIGHVVEYPTALQQITDDRTWVSQVWGSRPEESDQWGTAVMSEELMPAVQSVQDPGIWAQPPV